MTVGVNDRRAGPFTGDAVETVYGYDFTIVLNTDLEVYLYDTTTEVETLLAATSGLFYATAAELECEIGYLESQLDSTVKASR